MKLKEGFITHTAGNEHMMVASGKASEIFNGLIRSNDTAAFILEKLQSETTESEIVDAMLNEYDAPRSVIERDVNKIISQIRAEGFLDE